MHDPTEEATPTMEPALEDIPEHTNQGFMWLLAHREPTDPTPDQVQGTPTSASTARDCRHKSTDVGRQWLQSLFHFFADGATPWPSTPTGIGILLGYGGKTC